MLLDLSVTIDRPVEQVFAFIRDLDRQRHGDRVEGIEKITPGAVRVGTRYRERIRMPFGRRGELLIEVTELDPPHRLAVDFQGPVMRGGIVYILTPGERGTRVDQSEQISYTGWARPANTVGRPALRNKVRKRLDGFKSQLEG